eukprot:412039_1
MHCPKKSHHVFEMKHGVFRVYKVKKQRLKTPVESPIALKSRPSVEIKMQPSSESDDSDVEEKVQYEYIKQEQPLYSVHSFGEFIKDLVFLMELIHNGPARTFCYQRLQTLQAKFR